MTPITIEPWLDELMAQGYCVIPQLLSPRILSDLARDLEVPFRTTPFGQGHFYGYRTKRFGSLLRRSTRASEIVMEPTVLALAQAVLGAACDRIQLNVAQAIAIHPEISAQMYRPVGWGPFPGIVVAHSNNRKARKTALYARFDSDRYCLSADHGTCICDCEHKATLGLESTRNSHQAQQLQHHCVTVLGGTKL